MPSPFTMSPKECIFEAILEECSMKSIPVDSYSSDDLHIFKED